MSQLVLGQQFLFHGTTNEGARRMQQGLRNSGQTDPFGLGEGLHVTNNPATAAYFAREKAVRGMRAGTLEQKEPAFSRERPTGKRIGTTVVLKPKPGAQPRAVRPLNHAQNIGNPGSVEELFDASDLDVVGTQPVYRTSVQRALQSAARGSEPSPYERLQRQRQQAMKPRTPQQMKADYRRRTQPRGPVSPSDFN